MLKRLDWRELHGPTAADDSETASDSASELSTGIDTLVFRCVRAHRCDRAAQRTLCRADADAEVSGSEGEADSGRCLVDLASLPAGQLVTS